MLNSILYFPVSSAQPSTEELRSLQCRNLSFGFRRRLRRRAATPADVAAAPDGASRRYTRCECGGRESAATDRDRRGHRVVAGGKPSVDFDE